MTGITSIAHPQLLGLSGQRSEGLTAFLVLLLLVGQKITQADPPVGAHVAKGEQAFLQLIDQERTRHIPMATEKATPGAPTTC